MKLIYIMCLAQLGRSRPWFHVETKPVHQSYLQHSKNEWNCCHCSSQLFRIKYRRMSPPGLPCLQLLVLENILIEMYNQISTSSDTKWACLETLYFTAHLIWFIFLNYLCSLEHFKRCLFWWLIRLYFLLLELRHFMGYYIAVLAHQKCPIVIAVTWSVNWW